MGGVSAIVCTVWFDESENDGNHYMACTVRQKLSIGKMAFIPPPDVQGLQESVPRCMEAVVLYILLSVVKGE